MEKRDDLMTKIKTIEPENAEGELREIYDDLRKKRGKIAEIHKIQSLNPPSIKNHMNLYMTVMFGKSPLTRAQREMMAVVVSKANGCEYCITHHAEAVQHFWKDKKKVEQLKEDYRKIELNDIDRTLCEYAWHLTKNPKSVDKKNLVNALKKVGLLDRAVLDATLVVSYFNFVNRIVLALGVELEEQPGGYKYE